MAGMGGTTILVALACRRPLLRGVWRQVLALALLAGLLGGVALGAVAGARRTATAYGRYLTAINASDVFVNVPGWLPGLSATRPYELISALPGVVAHAAYIGLSGVPLVHGKAVNSFLVNGLNGSLDGEYFSQDRATVLAGRLPPQGSTSTVVLTPAVAKALGTGVGGTVSYKFQPVGPEQQPAGQPFTRSFRVAAIVEIPPALVDESDQEQGSLFPPGATRQLLPEYFYAWIGLRLAAGTAGTGDLQKHLTGLAAELQRQARQAVHRDVTPPSFTVNRTDVIRNRVQQAIRPEAVALSVFGAVAALAMLVLVGQGLAQMISRSAPDTAVLRALGATRAQAALAAAWPGLIAVLGGLALAVAGAVVVSPLAPVGPVRRYDPDRGISADGLVLGAGAAILGLALLGLLAVLAVRSVRPRDSEAGVGSSAAARAAAAAGLSAAAVVGTRNAFEPGSGVRAVPVRSALLGSIAAVTAVVTAVVFSASLGGLTAHPARYGWNWDLVIQAEAGYGAFARGKMSHLLHGQRAVAGWSEFAFAQLPIDGKVVPALGLRSDLGSVQPPTTSGRALSGPDQIELGTVTVRELGKKVGDQVRIGIAPYTRTAVITGTVTLPSFGVGATDHPGLGRGAMVPQGTLQAAMGQAPGERPTESESLPVLPSAVAIDLAPGTTAAQRAALVSRIVSANPDGTPGGSYELSHARASAIVNTEQMGGQPLALAVGLAVAAVLSLALTLMSLVRRRRRELALLKALGMTRGQVRGVIAWQTTLTLLIAVVVGGPLGIACGRLAWRAFAGSLGVVPIVEVPVAALVLGLAGLVLAGNLLAALPAAVAARTRPGVSLQAE
jgi:ABC-type lipoprotein release transport system permease subunit